MVTRTEKYNNEEIVPGIMYMEDANWCVRQIVPLASYQYLVVYERDES